MFAFLRRRTFRPGDVVTFLAPASNPLRMIVRAVRGEMCEVAPLDARDTTDTTWVNKMLLMKARR